MTEKQGIFTLLGGKVKMHHSKYNPTSDAVWLAALPDVEPKNILDVGVGSGGVALCLHHHFPNSAITGVDVSDEMLTICAKNAELNNCKIELINQDILNWSTAKTFDLVVSNPPYFKGTPSLENPIAHHNADLTHWVRRCIARVRPQGYFCTIIDASRTSEVIGVISKHCGDVTIIPLFGKKHTAERVLIKCRNCSKGKSIINIGFPMNYEPILRDGLTIQNILSNINEQC